MSQPAWRLGIGIAPWFGCCAGDCRCTDGGRRELGMDERDHTIERGELVASRDGQRWYCMPCLTEIVRTEQIADLRARARARRA